MGKNYFLAGDGSFVIKDYNHVHPFSNFLPGIAGEWGVPLWVFYTNRAQGVVSFGIKDKDHAISEFFPANKAYSFVPNLGFRTFIKVNGTRYYEPFRVVPDYRRKEKMIIRSASLEIKEVNPKAGLSFSVRYFTLPNISIGGLVRVVSIKNISKKKINLEALDGPSRIIPFGSSNPFLKDMSRTLEAWMRSSIDGNLAVFRLIVDPRDISQTKYIDGANFNYSFYHDKGKKIAPYMIVDPAAVFSQDVSCSSPVNFLRKNFKPPLNQILCGKTPCSFSWFRWNLLPGQEQTFYSIFGASFKPELIKKNIKVLDADFLKDKERENETVIESIKNNAFCVSGSKEFDHYVKCTYLDNVLRGGYPCCPKTSGVFSEKVKSKNIYYIFSRKHGDLERDYNHFQLLPSYFSEGEANYRDINQNRRMDLFFTPSLEYRNIIYFSNFIKIDGYNPLVIEGERLFFDESHARIILKKFGIKDQRLLHLMIKGFYLGDFFKLLEEEKIEINLSKEMPAESGFDPPLPASLAFSFQRDEETGSKQSKKAFFNGISRKEKLASALLTQGRREPRASHREGYWIDHWRYNLDLIESFLYFYPDKLKELFLSNNFVFWDEEYGVKKRMYRYFLRGGKVHQGESIEVARDKRAAIKKKGRFNNFLRTRKGEVYKTNFICKLLVLVLNKSATLDPEGIGIEMEADKPGWCDSLNGLPALFGSSLPETFELKRLVLILLSAIRRLKEKAVKEVTVPREVFLFLDKLHSLLRSFLSSDSKKRDYLWWDKANSLKENFRQKTFYCLEGKEEELALEKIEKFLEDLINRLNIGIAKARDKKSKLYFTYFTYTVKKYRFKNKHLIPLEFTKKPLPLFLEGVVHALRVEGRKNFHFDLRKSPLFDKKLKMYRLNASLKNESLEIGRSRIFVPGWLENESIWLHMEYKYLLELLKNGLYEDFFTDFYNCGVCFFDPQKYGRNILENSSFIVSSAYPDNLLWGKGFVARLSGATAELLNIWIFLCLGKKPFFMDKKGLCLRFSPVLKKNFFTANKKIIDFEGRKIILPKNTFSFKLFSKTLVVYHNPKRKDTFSKGCRIRKITVSTKDKKLSFPSGTIEPPLSLAVRDLKAERIDAYFE